MSKRALDFIRGARKAAQLVATWPRWKRESVVVGLRRERPSASPSTGQGEK